MQAPKLKVDSKIQQSKINFLNLGLDQVKDKTKVELRKNLRRYFGEKLLMLMCTLSSFINEHNLLLIFTNA